MTNDPCDGYKMTELGPLPQEWQVVRLEEVAEIRAGVAFPHEYQGSVEGSYPFYKVSDMNTFGNEIYMEKASNWVNSEILRKLKAKLFPSETVIFPKVGGALLTNKKRLLARESLIDNNIMGVIVRQDICIPQFCFYWFESIDIRMFSNPGPLPSINAQGVKKSFIPLPPLPEQRAIAHVLRTVQRAKEAAEGVIAALRELKKSLMQHLFTYGPVPVGAKDFSPQRESEIGPLPAHWRVVRLGEVFDILQGKSLSAKQNKGVRPRPFLRTSNVYWGYLDLSKLDVMDFTEEEEQKFALQRGDLLVCEGGDVGRTAMWEGQMQGVYYQNHLHRLRARDNNVNPAFVMYWLQTAFTLLNLYSGSSNKTTIPNLSQGRLAVFPIPLPPLDEQREIAHMLQAVDAKIAAEQARRAALEELFKSLLHELMSGQIRLPNIVGGQRSRDSAPDADPLPESED